MRIAVIGAGVSGLVAAYRLAEAGQAVTVFERDAQPGGLASSADIGGTRMDRYFHFICPPDAALLALIDELGLSDRLHWNSTRMGVFREGEYHRFGTPGSLLTFAPLPPSDRIRFARATLRAHSRRSWTDLDALTAREWLVAEQGERCYDTIWRPLLELKFGDSADRVSAAWMWARINRVARSRRGIGMQERLGYLDGGCATLIDALTSRICERGSRIVVSAQVERVVEEGGCATGVIVGGSFESFDAVIATTAPGILAELAPGLPAAYAAQLRAIEYCGVACLVIVADVALCDDFWLNIDDRRIPYPGVITYTNLNRQAGPGDAHVHYLPHYLPPGQVPAEEPEPSELPALLNALDRIRPGFSDRVREVHRFTDRYAQPLYTAGFAREHGSLMHAATPMRGLFRADMSQVYPQDRSLVNSVARADFAVRDVLAPGDMPGSAS